LRRETAALERVLHLEGELGAARAEQLADARASDERVAALDLKLAAAAAELKAQTAASIVHDDEAENASLYGAAAADTRGKETEPQPSLIVGGVTDANAHALSAEIKALHRRLSQLEQLSTASASSTSSRVSAGVLLDSKLCNAPPLPPPQYLKPQHQGRKFKQRRAGLKARQRHLVAARAEWRRRQGLRHAPPATAAAAGAGAGGVEAFLGRFLEEDGEEEETDKENVAVAVRAQEQVEERRRLDRETLALNAAIVALRHEEEAAAASASVSASTASASIKLDKCHRFSNGDGDADGSGGKAAVWSGIAAQLGRIERVLLQCKTPARRRRPFDISSSCVTRAAEEVPAPGAGDETVILSVRADVLARSQSIASACARKLIS
tara:strand:- start:1 stop:1146 length:1146 start_codon:yes stop_codon:yes gene_type:complete